MNLRAIIVDDEAISRKRLEHVASFCDEIKVIDSVGVPEEAVVKILELKPDILLLDVEMPGMTGFDVLDAVNKQGFNPTVIFVTAYDKYAIKAIRTKAFDYLLKPIHIEEFKGTIKRFIREQEAESLFGKLQFSESLSSREVEVLMLLIKGKSSKEIGEILFVSKNTVDTHRRKILDKTGAKTTAELIAMFYG